MLHNDTPSFVSLAHVYTDKTATNLKTNATVAHPVHVVLMKFNLNFRRFLSHHRQVLECCLTLWTALSHEDEYQEDLVKKKQFIPPNEVPLQYLLPASMERDARGCKLERLHDTKWGIWRTLIVGIQSVASVVFFKKSLTFYPAIVSYSCYISEGKDMSGVKHCGTMCPCIPCLIKYFTLQSYRREGYVLKTKWKTFIVMFTFLMGRLISYSRKGESEPLDQNLKEGCYLWPIISWAKKAECFHAYLCQIYVEWTSHNMYIRLSRWTSFN